MSTTTTTNGVPMYSRSLADSRARIVAMADATRRRIERDLHDGSQQRLITLALELHALKETVPAERPDLLGQLTHIQEGLRAALEELREIARGIHPAALSEGGLRAGLKSLAQRSVLPVELELGTLHRLPEPVEVAAYYIVSEAIANTTKHAHASVNQIELSVLDHSLHLSVRDDGAGGADPNRGSGLVGLNDRVETLGGTITLQSPLCGGTTLHVELPLNELRRCAVDDTKHGSDGGRRAIEADVLVSPEVRPAHRLVLKVSALYGSLGAARGSNRDWPAATRGTPPAVLRPRTTTPTTRHTTALRAQAAPPASGIRAAESGASRAQARRSGRE